jgi:hypothetical protein
MDVGHRNRLLRRRHQVLRHRSLDAKRHRRHRQSLDVNQVRHPGEARHPDGPDRRHQPDVDRPDAADLDAVRMGCFQLDEPLGVGYPCPGLLQTGCYPDEEYQLALPLEQLAELPQSVLLEPQPQEPLVHLEPQGLELLEFLLLEPELP